MTEPAVVTPWELFPHEADMGVRGYGTTPSEAFERAATGLTAVITVPDPVRPLEPVEIACQAPPLPTCSYSAYP